MASPLDSQYAQGVARLLFQNQQQRQQINQTGADDSTDFQTQLKRMAEAKAQTLHNTGHQANREGLFYSGQLGKRFGDVEHDYANQQGDAQTQFDRRVSARASALSGLGTVTADPNSPLGYTGTGTAGFDLGDLFNAASGRQLDRDAQAQFAAQQQQPDAGAPPAAAGAPAPPAPPGAPAGATKTAPSQAHGGQKWVYRQGANGTWIPVRPANAWGY